MLYHLVYSTIFVYEHSSNLFHTSLTSLPSLSTSYFTTVILLQSQHSIHLFLIVPSTSSRAKETEMTYSVCPHLCLPSQRRILIIKASLELPPIHSCFIRPPTPTPRSSCNERYGWMNEGMIEEREKEGKKERMTRRVEGWKEGTAEGSKEETTKERKKQSKERKKDGRK